MGEGFALAIAAAAIAFAVGFAVVALRRGRRIAELESLTAARPAPPPDLPGPGTELVRLLEAARMGLLHVGPDGVISWTGGLACELVARPTDALVGSSPIAAFVDHRVDGLLAQAKRQGSARLDLVLPGEPQRTLTLRAEGAADGRSLWILVADVSELSRLRRIRTEFIDNLSHELRTPLTTLRVLAEVLSGEAERTQLPERVHDAIAKIEVETGHLVQMVTELLDLARIEQGETPLRRDRLDLGKIVEGTIARLRPYAERQGVPLRGEMPGIEAERSVDGDAERLGQLLLNLLHNAIKFSEPGSEVLVRVTAGAAVVRAEVMDHGPGIPRQDLERVFERFYKVDRARTRGDHGGTGLGLAIARHIAEGHGGRIWTESEEGSGATFILELPRA
jgi:two-component system, OmpR family, phosphate regulon sensor histidine kinase PhoR